MANRAMVIKGLECCKWSRRNVQPEKNRCDECPYKDQGIMNAFTVWRSCINVLADDTLALLKKQEEQIKKFELERNWDEHPDTMGKW